MWRKVVEAKQVKGKTDALLATIEINAAKNSLARKAGFSPAQWVLGRDVRVPACLVDDGEAQRISAQVASMTLTARFAWKVELREASRVAFTLAANSEAVRRAELRKVRPTRGPFEVGQWIFFYDGSTAEARRTQQ